MTSRGNIASQKSSVRLVELGPRISMELLKIEEGMLDGETLYHRHITKTDEEKKQIKRILEKRKKEKLQRKQVGTSSLITSWRKKLPTVCLPKNMAIDGSILIMIKNLKYGIYHITCAINN